MKNDNYIATVNDLIATTEQLASLPDDRYILFRGQPCKKPLLPKIARNNPKNNSTALEAKMVKEFRRRLARERDISAMDAWDILIYAQHHGLSTRLLDWTTNPLFALWFACANYTSSSDSYIYLLTAKEESLLDASTEKDPFKIKKTYVVKPNLNNSRIRAQSGWFTAHRYSKEARQFVAIDKNISIDGVVKIKGIHASNKLNILITLDKLGVNEESVFPGPEGTARHINWIHRDDLSLTSKRTRTKRAPFTRDVRYRKKCQIHHDY